MSTLVRRRLTPDEMDAIEANIEAAETLYEALEAGLITVFDALLGDIGRSFVTEEGAIDGQQFQIPGDQWQQVCQWLVDRGHDLSPVDRVNLGLTFMNIGPSSYVEEVPR